MILLILVARCWVCTPGLNRIRDTLLCTQIELQRASFNGVPRLLSTQGTQSYTAGVSTVVFEGDDKKYSLSCGFLTEKKKKLPKTLCACVFDDHEKKIELDFENQGGEYKLSKVSKEGFDVQRELKVHQSFFKSLHTPL